ncbi:MAG: DUF1800 family protein [Bacteroidota bacterium]
MNQLTETLGKKRAAHLLRRACSGASIAQIDEFANLTPQQAVQRLFDNDLPTPPLPIDPATGMEWITGGPTDANEDSNLDALLNQWMVGQMLAIDVPAEKQLAYSLRERLVFFLHTHFTTKRSVVRSTQAIYYQNALFRIFAFDKDDVTITNPDPTLPNTVYERSFRKLTEKISVENAMLVFLDGRLNVRGRPNENFARELLELYSVGRGLEGSKPEPEFEGDYFHFTEEDVQEGARVLSGFDVDDNFLNIDEETGLPRGVIKGNTVAAQHDNGTKVFSQRLGGESVSPNADLLVNGNPVEESLLDEVAQLVALIYRQDETARHICRKIYRFFVYHNISDELQNDIIQEMADVFTANNFKLQPVLETLFASQHFYDADGGPQDNNFGGLIKSPLDLTLGFVKNFEITVPSYATDPVSFYQFVGDLMSSLGRMGMDFYEPFEVAGYSSYHQFPIYNRSWITTNYLTQRYNFIRDRISIEAPMMGQVNIYDFVKANIPDSEASDTRLLVIALAEYFLPVSADLSYTEADSELTAERLNYFRSQILFDGSADPETYWTERWATVPDLGDITQQLSNLINAMLQSPEYQLM